MWEDGRGAGVLRGRGRGAVRGTWAPSPREGRGAAGGGPGAQPSSRGLPSGVAPGQLGVRAELKTGSSPCPVRGWREQRATCHLPALLGPPTGLHCGCSGPGTGKIPF